MIDVISQDEFWTDWGLILKATGDLLTFDEVRDQPLTNVWTIIESGSDQDGNWYASPGFHVVNRIGYVMTTKPWTNYTLDAVYFLDDFDHDE
jgi:hypothetical protein